MKKFCVTLSLFYVILFGMAQPKMEFVKTLHDFGVVKEDGGIVSFVFEFKNTGNAPVILTNVVASCGCTTSEWTREPVAPGSKGKIEAIFDPLRRPGINEKEIAVSSNAGKVVLKFRANVKSDKLGETAPRFQFSLGTLQTTYSVLHISQILNTQTVTDSMAVYNGTARPMSITFNNVPEHMSLWVIPAKLEPKKAGYIYCTYNAVKKQDYGIVNDKVTVLVNNKPEQKQLIVTANIGEDFSKLPPKDYDQIPQAKVDKVVKDLGKVPRNSQQRVTYSLTNSGERDLLIRKINPSSPTISDVKYPEVVKPGEKVTIEFLFTASNTPGRVFEQATVIMNNPFRPILSLRVKAQVE